MREAGQRILRNVVTGVLPYLLYRIIIDNASKERLENIKEIVNQRSNLNLIFYFNHTSIVDPLFVGNIAVRINPKGKIVAPMSYSNTENKPENKKNIAMGKIIEACGVKTFRVIQSYQINNPEYNYSPEIIGRQNMAFIRGVGKLAKEEKGTPISMIISPEGHRTEGSLIRAESGIVFSGSLLAPTLYVPVGIDFEGDIDKGMNLFKRVNLSIGETYLQESPKDRVDLDVLMYNLAAVLPEARRGVYATPQSR
jgi:hypothetical protein